MKRLPRYVVLEDCARLAGKIQQAGSLIKEAKSTAASVSGFA
jgi:hypothetical protein